MLFQILVQNLRKFKNKIPQRFDATTRQGPIDRAHQEQIIASLVFGNPQVAEFTTTRINDLVVAESPVNLHHGATQMKFKNARPKKEPAHHDNRLERTEFFVAIFARPGLFGGDRNQTSLSSRSVKESRPLVILNGMTLCAQSHQQAGGVATPQARRPPPPTPCQPLSIAASRSQIERSDSIERT